MTRLGEVARAITALGYYFAAAPLVALQTPAAGLAVARARALAHAARARRIAGMSFEVSGEEFVPRSGGFVLVYNQTSLVDDLADIEVVWRLSERNVLASEYARIPFFRRAAARTGVLLLQRGDRAAADRVLESLVTHAAAGGRVAMAAEGRLSRDGAVGHFKRGAFLVAIRAGVPVVPMAVCGGRELMPPGTLRLRRGVLHYRLGPPLETSGLDEERAPALAERARRVVTALLEEARRARGATERCG